jgi:hypothetical protein
MLEPILDTNSLSPAEAVGTILPDLVYVPEAIPVDEIPLFMDRLEGVLTAVAVKSLAVTGYIDVAGYRRLMWKLQHEEPEMRAEARVETRSLLVETWYARSEESPVIVYGLPGSGKSAALTAMIEQNIIDHKADDGDPNIVFGIDDVFDKQNSIYSYIESRIGKSMGMILAMQAVMGKDKEHPSVAGYVGAREIPGILAKAGINYENCAPEEIDNILSLTALVFPAKKIVNLVVSDDERKSRMLEDRRRKLEVGEVDHRSSLFIDAARTANTYAYLNRLLDFYPAEVVVNVDYMPDLETEEGRGSLADQPFVTDAGLDMRPEQINIVGIMDRLEQLRGELDDLNVAAVLANLNPESWKNQECMVFQLAPRIHKLIYNIFANNFPLDLAYIAPEQLKQPEALNNLVGIIWDRIQNEYTFNEYHELAKKYDLIQLAIIDKLAVTLANMKRRSISKRLQMDHATQSVRLAEAA